MKHQRAQEENKKTFARIEDFYVRGQKGQVATRFRKGACENCGAMTHKKKDCLERPRKIGAKFSGDLAPDEVILPNLNLDYDGKRDRWNGFEPEMYKFVIDEHSKIEEAKRQLKEDKLKQDLVNDESKGEEKDGESDSEEDEDEKYADHIDMPGTKVDSKQRITVRNLRIREDTAKYLRNLDLESAYYDPKTRSMRDNPYKTKGKTPDDLPFAGDNFVRYTGDTQNISQVQTFAWQAYEKGVDIHLQAEPTKAELLHKEYAVKKEEYKEGVKDNILKKYGGEEHLKVPPKELIFAQTEHYVEYSRQGQIIKGCEKPVIKSIYEEDIYINNHTFVWGSFWKDGKWGYKCCHSMIKNSYCTGNIGKDDIFSGNRIILLPNDDDEDDYQNNSNSNKNDDKEKEVKSLLEQHQEKLEALAKDKKKNKKRGDEDEDEEKSKDIKLKKALEEEEEKRKNAERLLKMDERKRPYNSMYEAKAPTEEELEAYHLKRAREEDPMAYFKK